MKDFDFTPATSASDLTGFVLMPRGVASLTVWQKRPFDAGHALADLYVKANTDAGEWTNKRGLVIPYQAGWVIWTNKGLAECWGWRRESVEKFMVELEKSEIIRRHEVGQYGKVIELLEYGHPNGHGKGSERAANGQPDGHRTDTVGDGDTWKEKGEAPPRLVTLDMAVSWCEANAAGYSRDQIAEQWAYYDATRDPQTGQWLRPGRTGLPLPISDWRSELSRALSRFATEATAELGEATSNGWQKKNGGTAVDEISRQKRLTAVTRELAELAEQMDALDQAGAEIPAELKKRRTELEAEKKGLTA